MTIFLIVAGIIVCAGLAWFFLRKPSSNANSMEKASKGMSPEMVELYEKGLAPGTDGVPLMYALETCRHCRKTREFLDENQVQYHILYVDKYEGEARAALMDKVRSYNPRGSFPTIVFPGDRAVVGFREQLLREALLHDTGSST